MSDPGPNTTNPRTYGSGYRGTQHQLVRALLRPTGDETLDCVHSAAVEEIERLEAILDVIKEAMQ